MNLVLFDPHELGVPLSIGDRRAQHVVRVLRRRVGETFDAGIVNGPRGKATVVSVDDRALTYVFTPGAEPRSPSPMTLLVGLPRPQTARDVLRDATTLGVAAMHFVRTDKAEASYAQSSLWTSGEWRRHVLLGAEQAFDTRLPEVTFDRPLRDVLAGLAFSSPSRSFLALDNYEAAESMATVSLPPGSGAVIAIGSERGWSAAEREMLREHRFGFVHLGPRVLRTETAVIAALTLVAAKLGL